MAWPCVGVGYWGAGRAAPYAIHTHTYTHTDTYHGWRGPVWVWDTGGLAEQRRMQASLEACETHDDGDADS